PEKYTSLKTEEVLNLYKTKMTEKALVDYSELEEYMKNIGIKSFDSSQFSEINIIGRGGSAIVYSTIFQKKKCVLKSLNNNLLLDEKRFKQIKHKVSRDERSDIYSLGVLLWELTSGVPPFHGLNIATIILEISQNKREKIIANTPSDYANLVEKCWSSDPDQRPTLDQILIELENLSNKTTIEFITNENIKNNQQIAQPESNDENSLNFFNCRTETTCKRHDESYPKEESQVLPGPHLSNNRNIDKIESNNDKHSNDTSSDSSQLGEVILDNAPKTSNTDMQSLISSEEILK
ncbi:11230_t:CDS:2, partial [Dentiscutata erythropus]